MFQVRRRETLVVVAGVPIRQDADGRYCLNDLHKSSGGVAHHQPAKFFENSTTQALVTELVNSPNSEIKPVNAIRGRSGGTFVCKELVYAYANWISPAFYLNVIRIYDAVVTGSPVVSMTNSLPPVLANQIGGIVKSIVNKALRDTLPAMVEAELAHRHMSIRHGRTAGQCWKHYGYPTKGMRGYAQWFSHRLTNMGCLVSGGGRAELGSSTAKLYDIDKVSTAMEYGLRLACDQYVAGKRGQRNLFTIHSGNGR